MDLFPAGTSIVACSRPFGHVVAGRVFEVPFGEVYDQAEGCRVPFHCLAGRSNVMEVVSVPMVQPVVMMEDLNLDERDGERNTTLINCLKLRYQLRSAVFLSIYF